MKIFYPFRRIESRGHSPADSVAITTRISWTFNSIRSPLTRRTLLRLARDLCSMAVGALAIVAPFTWPRIRSTELPRLTVYRSPRRWTNSTLLNWLRPFSFLPANRLNNCRGNVISSGIWHFRWCSTVPHVLTFSRTRQSTSAQSRCLRLHVSIRLWRHNL